MNKFEAYEAEINGLKTERESLLAEIKKLEQDHINATAEYEKKIEELQYKHDATCGTTLKPIHEFFRIPESVRIGSFDYSVEVKDERLLLDRRQVKGMIDYEYHIIQIDSGVQDKQGQEQTFLHELIHGIIRERNINTETSDEEGIVDEIASGLHQFIRDNPEVFRKQTRTEVEV